MFIALPYGAHTLLVERTAARYVADGMPINRRAECPARFPAVVCVLPFV
jgi:hypothetical protein